jgi:hypothetical protein
LTRSVLDILDGVKSREEAKGGSELVVDITGCGRSGAAMLKRDGVNPILVTVTLGADESMGEYGDWRVGKAELVSNLQVLFQTNKLRVSQGMPLSAMFVAELQNFKMKPPPLNAHDLDAWRLGAHDDLVLAAAVGAWRAVRNVPAPLTLRLAREARAKEGSASAWMGS